MTSSGQQRRYRIIGRVGFEGARTSVAAIAPIAWLAVTVTVISAVLTGTRGGQLADGTAVQLTLATWPFVGVAAAAVFLIAMRAVQRADTYEAVLRTLRTARIAVIAVGVAVYALCVWQFFSASLDAAMSLPFVATSLN